METLSLLKSSSDLTTNEEKLTGSAVENTKHKQKLYNQKEFYLEYKTVKVKVRLNPLFGKSHEVEQSRQMIETTDELFQRINAFASSKNATIVNIESIWCVSGGQYGTSGSNHHPDGYRVFYSYSP